MPLPGWPVKVIGNFLPDAYSLREDEDFIYLCWEGRVVAEFTNNATVQKIQEAMYQNIVERALFATTVNRMMG